MALNELREDVLILVLHNQFRVSLSKANLSKVSSEKQMRDTLTPLFFAKCRPATCQALLKDDYSILDPLLIAAMPTLPPINLTKIQYA